MTFDPMLREAFIVGLVVRGDPVEANRQQTAFGLAMLVESSYSPLSWFFGLTSEVGNIITVSRFARRRREEGSLQLVEGSTNGVREGV